MNRIEILREKITKLAGLLTERKVKVTQRGIQAYVTYKDNLPVLVNVPFIPDNATDQFTRSIEGFLDHEIAHVLFSKGKVLDDARKMGIAGFHNATEDIYIEGAMSEKFPGSKHNLTTMHDLFIRDYIDDGFIKHKNEPVKYLLVPLLRALAGQGAFIDYMKNKMDIPEIADIVNKIGGYCKSELPKMKSSEDALAAAAKIKELLSTPPTPAPPPQEKQKNKENGGSGNTPEDEGEQGPSTKENEDDNAEPSSPSNASESGVAEPSEDGENEDNSEKQEEHSPENSNNEPSEDTKPDEGASEKYGKDDVEDGSNDNNGPEQSEENRGDDEDSENNHETKNDNQEGGSEDNDSKNDTSDDAEQSDGDGDNSDDGDGDASDSNLNDNGQDGGSVDANEGEVGDDAKNADNQFHQKPKDHLDLDLNANGLSIDVKALQDSMRDFDEVIADLITRDAMEVADSSDYFIYSRDFDVIEKFDARARKVADSAINVKTMTDEVDKMVGKVQRDLERSVAALNKVSWVGDKRSGVINNSALNRLVNFGEEKVFKRKYETKAKNTAVTLLIDCSASMDIGDKIKIAAYTAYAMSSALERLNINHEILGFTTLPTANQEIQKELNKGNAEKYSRIDDIYIPIFKSFSEKLTPVVKEGLASLPYAQWLECNIDGESVEIAASRLAKQKEERKILIVLSDGNPVCYGDKKALRSHLKKTVKNVEKSGIEVLGIGIMDDAVKSYYKKHIVIKNLQELPTTVMQSVRKLLTS